MREIDDRYPEYARPYEPLRGGRHHGRLTGNEGAAFQHRFLLYLSAYGILSSIYRFFRSVYSMKMIEPTAEYCQQIQAYRKEFLDCGDSMDGTGGLRRIEDPAKWIELSCLYKNPDSVPEGLVPATQYMFVREEDNKIVGMLQIRHYLNDYLEKYGGHIGYSVVPSERRKGYASQMLKLALPKCRELGMDKVLITCIDNNMGSRKTILANGGAYESTVYEPDEKVYLEKYWIRLSD